MKNHKEIKETINEIRKRLGMGPIKEKTYEDYLLESKGREENKKIKNNKK